MQPLVLASNTHTHTHPSSSFLFCFFLLFVFPPAAPNRRAGIRAILRSAEGSAGSQKHLKQPHPGGKQQQHVAFSSQSGHPTYFIRPSHVPSSPSSPLVPSRPTLPTLYLSSTMSHLPEQATNSQILKSQNPKILNYQIQILYPNPVSLDLCLYLCLCPCLCSYLCLCPLFKLPNQLAD